MKFNPDDYDFDEVEEIKIPTHHVYKLIFKKKGRVLKETYEDGSRWERYRETPSVIFNEIN